MAQVISHHFAFANFLSFVEFHGGIRFAIPPYNTYARKCIPQNTKTC